MSGQPLVSIVTPAYNQAEFLRETVESVLAQSYPAIEYIVIDDGSTDATPQVLEQLPPTVLAFSQANSGQANTLNRGWGMAKGKYLAYLSSDDVLYVDAIAELVAFLEAHPAAACVFPDCDLIDTRSRVVKRNVCRPFDLAELVVRQECYIGPGALFRHDAFKQASGWRSDLKLAPDREFWMRLARAGEIAFLPRSLAGYRMHQRSISYSEVSEDVAREYLRLVDEYFSEPNGLPPSVATRHQEAIGYATLLLARNCLRGGRIRRARELYREACDHYPPLRALRIKMSLLRTALSKPVRIQIDKLRSVIEPALRSGR